MLWWRRQADHVDCRAKGDPRRMEPFGWWVTGAPCWWRRGPWELTHSPGVNRREIGRRCNGRRRGNRGGDDGWGRRTDHHNPLGEPPHDFASLRTRRSAAEAQGFHEPTARPRRRRRLETAETGKCLCGDAKRIASVSIDHGLHHTTTATLATPAVVFSTDRCPAC